MFLIPTNIAVFSILNTKLIFYINTSKQPVLKYCKIIKKREAPLEKEPMDCILTSYNYPNQMK